MTEVATGLFGSKAFSQPKVQPLPQQQTETTEEEAQRRRRRLVTDQTQTVLTSGQGLAGNQGRTLLGG